MEEKIEIRAVIFDMDGLIFDSERVVKKSWSSASKILGLPDVGEQIYHTLGMNRKSRNVYFRKTFGENFPAEEFADMTRKEFRRIVSEKPVELKPGFTELAKLLNSRGIKMAIATSSSEGYARDLLERAKIDIYFDAFAFGDGVKNSKPDPEIYLKAIGLLKIDASDIIALEDAPIGVRAAYNAGLKTIMVPDLVAPDEETKALCFKVLKSLNEVREYVKGVRL